MAILNPTERQLSRLAFISKRRGQGRPQTAEIQRKAITAPYARGGSHSFTGIPEYREAINKVIDSKEALKMAGSLLLSVSKDERERAVFRSRRMLQTDLQSNLATRAFFMLGIEYDIINETLE